MMENMKFGISNLRFTEQEEVPVVQIYFNTTGGQVNMNGHVIVTQEAFFASNSSTDEIVTLVKAEVATLLGPATT